MIKKIVIVFLSLALFCSLLLGFHFYGREVSFIKQLYPYFPQSLRNDINRLARAILKSPDLLYIFKKTEKSKILTFELTVQANDWQKLNQDLPTAWSQTERLTGQYRKYVRADLKIGDEEYQVKIRFRGWTPEHWSEIKKSFQIRFVAPSSLQGKKIIKFILPEDRFFFVESLSNFIARKLKLVALEDGFARVVINNQDYGIYYWVEDFGKAVLERKGIDGETEFFSEIDFLPEVNNPNAFTSINFWEKDTEGSFFTDQDFTRLEKLLEVTREGDQEQLFALIDKDYFLAWQAHSMLIATTHQDYAHNNRFFWDKAIDKFKIIPWDNGSEIDPELLDVNYNPLINKIFEDPALVQERNKILWSYLKENTEEDVNFLEGQYQKYRYWFYRDGGKIYPNWQFDRESQRIKENLEKRYENLKIMVTTLKPKVGLAQEAGKITIKIRNEDRVGLLIDSLNLPVACSRINTGFQKISLAESECQVKVQDLLLPHFAIPQGPERFVEPYELIPQEYQLKLGLAEAEKISPEAIKFNLLNQVTQEVVDYETF